VVRAQALRLRRGPADPLAGRALLAGYLVFVLPFGWLLSWADAEARVFAICALIAATFILVLVAKTKTRGGWKWRSGGGD